MLQSDLNILPVLLLGSLNFVGSSSKGVVHQTGLPHIPDVYIGGLREDRKASGTAGAVMMDRGAGIPVSRKYIAGIPALVECHSEHMAIIIVSKRDLPTHCVTVDISEDEVWIRVNDRVDIENALTCSEQTDV